MKGERKKLSFYKKRGGGVQKGLSCLEWGVQKVSDKRFSHFVGPLPIINYWSLSAAFSCFPVNHSFPSYVSNVQIAALSNFKHTLHQNLCLIMDNIVGEGQCESLK